MINLIYDQALVKLNNQKANMQELLENHQEDDIGKFINKVLTWYFDKNKKHMLWEIFHNVFDLSPLLFMETFCSFVVNSLLDDSAFRIEYRKLSLNKDFNLIWQNGEFKTDLSSEEDLDANPIVYWDNDGSQDVNLLLKAMDHAELRRLKRIKLEKETKDLIELIKK